MPVMSLNLCEGQQHQNALTADGETRKQRGYTCRQTDKVAANHSIVPDSPVCYDQEGATPAEKLLPALKLFLLRPDRRSS